MKLFNKQGKQLKKLLKFLSKEKTTMNIEIELNYINKWLKKLCLLQKIFIQDIHFVFFLTMQLATLIMQKILFKLKI